MIEFDSIVADVTSIITSHKYADSIKISFVIMKSL